MFCFLECYPYTASSLLYSPFGVVLTPLTVLAFILPLCHPRTVTFLVSLSFLAYSLHRNHPGRLLPFVYSLHFNLPGHFSLRCYPHTLASWLVFSLLCHPRTATFLVSFSFGVFLTP